MIQLTNFVISDIFKDMIIINYSECFQRQQFLFQANSELGGIWSVGQRIWQRDFPGIYTTINAHQWSETVQPIMEALRGSVSLWLSHVAFRLSLERVLIKWTALIWDSL